MTVMFLNGKWAALADLNPLSGTEKWHGVVDLDNYVEALFRNQWGRLAKKNLDYLVVGSELLVLTARFRYLKHSFGGKRCSDNEEVKAAVNSWLFNQAEDSFEEGFQNIILSYDKCINKLGNYVNKWKKDCQVIYSQFGLAIHQNDHQARRRFVEWAQNEIAVVPDFHKRILFIDEAHFWLNGYVNKQNCRIWSEANPQVYVETPLHPEKLIVWCALWAGGILLQKR
ncbi:hypothetical protein TNCV_2397701 [Trichonephila clavipes]|uniref:Transposase n=1 Tax=Trichonephila clavipes TaxID=2585209 RepID=A0A8X6VM84_TRICX|nr:hypothetical protein TNCV_2397701 [Trichonephila clavipes]